MPVLAPVMTRTGSSAIARRFYQAGWCAPAFPVADLGRTGPALLPSPRGRPDDGLRTEPLDRPGPGGRSLVAKAVVQPVRRVLPELPRPRLEPVAAPFLGHRQLAA